MKRLKRPWRIKVIQALLKAAWWLARPEVNGVKCGEHYEVVIDADLERMNNMRCFRMKDGLLVVQGFEVMKTTAPGTALDDETRKEIEKMIEGEGK